MFKAPTVKAEDWVGWVWPVPITGGRPPTITQEWKPGRDPVPGQASGATTNHLGVDIMFRKGPKDPAGKAKHDATAAYIAPAGTKVIAAGPGQVWSAGTTQYGGFVLLDHGVVSANAGGVNTFYQHLDRLEKAWKKGDRVRAGDVLGTMGFAPIDPEGLRHLHFELRFPRTGVPLDESRVNPAVYMPHWRKVTLP